MTVYKGYMKIIKRNLGLLGLYLAIFMSINIIFHAATGEADYAVYQAESINIALVDQDGGSLARGLKAYLEQFHHVVLVENDAGALQEELYYRNIEYILRIPADFYEHCILAGEPVEVTKIPGSYSSIYVDQQLNTFLNNARVYAAAGFTEEEMGKALSKECSVSVKLLDKSGNAGELPPYAFYFRYLPYLFLSVLCFGIGNMMRAFKKDDLPKRMQASAVPVYRQSLEGLLAAGTMAAGIWGISILAALVLYGSSLTKNPAFGYYLINSVLLLLVALSLAWLVGTLTKEINQLNGVVNVLSLALCFLCGVFVPLEYMSMGVKKAAQFLPVYWYESVNDLLVEFGSITGNVKNTVLQGMGVQLVFAAALVCITLAAAKWKRGA